jgi:hypothetical protein
MSFGEALAELTAAHLLAVVAALHHDGVGKTLDDGALRLAEALLLPSASRVGKKRNGLVEELESTRHTQVHESKTKKIIEIVTDSQRS